MYDRNKKIQRTKLTKNFLFLCIICLLVFLVSSCAGRSRYKQVVTNFWEDENRTSVILRFSEKRVDTATVTGEADWVSYAIDSAIDCALFGAEGLLIGSAIDGPKRKEGDPEFQEEINEVVINTIRAEDDYFVDHFLKKLAFSPPIKPDFKVSSKEQLRSEEQESVIKPADQYLIVDLFLGFSGREKGWSAKVWLGALTSLWLIKDKETFHRFLNGEYRYSLKPLTLHCYIEDVPNLQNELPKIVGVFGIKVFTKDFKKDKWLVDNGQFFDKQLKFLLARLASEINQRVLDVD